MAWRPSKGGVCDTWTFGRRPLPCRRTCSLLSDFLPLTSPFRSRSARPLTTPATTHVMTTQPRHNNNNNVSVARLYDWSADGEKEEMVSVSRLYREIAGGGGAGAGGGSGGGGAGGGLQLRNVTDKVGRTPRGIPANGPGVGPTVGVGGVWPGGLSPRVNPGRMFLRDKGMLTKGEREIIQGIYKNRGDLRKYPLNNKSSDFFVRSHNDAWLVGKPGLPSNKPSTEVPRDSPRGSLMEVTVPAAVNNTESSRHSQAVDGTGHRETGNGNHGQAPRTTCIVCIREQQLLEQMQKQLQQGQKKKPQKNTPLASLPPQVPATLRPVHVNVNDTFVPRGEEGLTAPPTSPCPFVRPLEHQVKLSPVQSPSPSISSKSKLLPKRKQEAQGVVPDTEGPADSVPPWAAQHGDTDSEESSQDSEEGGSRMGKLHVKVYLPMVSPEAGDEDFMTCILEGRPAIARERHLSYTDLRRERRQEEGGMERVGVKEDGVRWQAEEEGQEVEAGRVEVKESRDTKNKVTRGREKATEPSRKERVRLKPLHPPKTSTGGIGSNNSSVKSGGGEGVAGQGSGGVDSDSDSSKISASCRRVPLHTHPVTILKADPEEEDSRPQE